MALKLVDDVDNSVFDNEISSIEMAYLSKQFRNFFKIRGNYSLPTCGLPQI